MKREELEISIGDKVAVEAKVVMARTALKKKAYKIQVGNYQIWIDESYIVGKAKE